MSQGAIVDRLSSYLGEVAERPKIKQELSQMNLIRLEGSRAGLLAQGEIFFEELSQRRTMLGLRSVFYHEGVLNYLAMALMRTENYLWFLDTTDQACLRSLTVEELKGLIAAMIAPGEEAPALEEKSGAMDEGIQANAASQESLSRPSDDAHTATQAAPRPKFCSKCGEKLSPESKFCKKCGNKIGS